MYEMCTIEMYFYYYNCITITIIIIYILIKFLMKQENAKDALKEEFCGRSFHKWKLHRTIKNWKISPKKFTLQI